MKKIHNSKLIKSASYLAVGTALIIMLIKFYGWYLTQSQSMFASLVDSTLDISSSLLNLIAVRIALLPPDDNHRFGHEKFQDLAVFSQSVFFCLSGLVTLFFSVKSLYLQAAPNQMQLGMNAMLVCLILTIILVAYQTYVVRQTQSKIIAADKLHYFTDLLSNIAVILSLYLSHQFWYVDGLAGSAISIYIISASYKLFRSSLKALVDEEFSQADRQIVLQIISQCKEAKGIHELKTRVAGNKMFIQFHLELDGNLSLNAAHAITHRVLNDLHIKFPVAEIIIHQDPAGLNENEQYVETIPVQQ